MRLAFSATVGLMLLCGGARAWRHDPTPAGALAGRTAGAPVQCISEPRIDDTQTFDSGEILYRMKSGPDYLNSPSPRCVGLRGNTGLVTRTPSTSLCRGDIAEVVDFTSGAHYGGCPLGDFIPYPRVKRR